MSRILLLSLCVASVPMIGLAHNGVILSVPTTVSESTSDDGTKELTIKNNVIPQHELEAQVAIKRYLIKKFGENAVHWPIMIRLKEEKALVLNEVTGQLFELPLQAL